MDEQEAKYWRDRHIMEGGSTGTGSIRPVIDRASAIMMGVAPQNYEKIIIDSPVVKEAIKKGTGEKPYWRMREEIKDGLEKHNEEVFYKAQDNQFEPYSINWIDNENLTTWKQIKAYTVGCIKRSGELLMLAHSNDSITGKPQLITEVKQTIPLIQKMEKIDKDENAVVSYKFIDDRIDKRFDGFEKESYEEAFYVYRVIHNDLEYIVFSKEKLDPEQYTFKGMCIKMQTIPQLTKDLKVRSASNVFFAKECHSTVKIMSKEELIEFTKFLRDKIGLDGEGFTRLTFLHPDGKVYLHSPVYNKVRVAQLLSGKYEGYPLSVGNMGPLAKGKTKELEALDYKFNESKGICEAGNSTPKVLVPSFKEKPASPGYILECNRVALIDELMKMVANANNGTRQGEIVRNSLGQLNMILEHKKRTIGSGNDNSLVAKATAKCLFATNPLPGKSKLSDHLSIVDETTMSRILWLVQDEEEQEFINNNKPEKCGNTYTIQYIQNEGGIIYRESVTTLFYIQIYDSCQVFLSSGNEGRIREIFSTSVNMLSEPMRSVWKGRGLHHTTLLLDGIVKFRCLFRDYDPTFTATEEDYNELQAILTRIVTSWDTDLSLKEDTHARYVGGQIR